MVDDANNPGAGLTDEQLLALYRGGRGELFPLLVERYRVELFQFLARFVGNRASAEDLFQEAFLQVHLSAETFDVTKRFKPWLFTIAANKARDFLRRNNRRQTTAYSAPIGSSGGGDAGGGDSGDSGRSFLDLMAMDLPQPSEDFERKETQELVQKAIARMPDHLREILLLAYFHQFPYRQIAEMLSVPLGTVKSRLHAAVAAFAEEWQREHGAEDE